MRPQLLRLLRGQKAGLTFGSGAPFGLTAAEHASWLRFGGGMDLISGLYDKTGILYFPAGNTGSQMGGWFNKEIRTTDDLDGLRGHENVRRHPHRQALPGAGRRH